jgi:hypothetical protein
LDYHGGDERDEVFSADEEHRVDSEAEGSFVEEEDLGSQVIQKGGRGKNTSAMEEEGRDSQGETPMPVIILPMRSIVHEGAVAHQIHPIRNINWPSK